MSQSGTTTKDSRVKQIIQLLRMQPSLRTKELAELVGLTASHIQHLFTREVGVSITVYSSNIRLDRAWHLLTTTSLAIKEVAHDVGVPDASNFTHRFKQRFGMPPSEVRKSCSDQQKAVLTNRNELRPEALFVSTVATIQLEP